jgi:hypothetical protein
MKIPCRLKAIEQFILFLDQSEEDELVISIEGGRFVRVEKGQVKLELKIVVEEEETA